MFLTFKEIENYKIVMRGWNISNGNSKNPLFFCDINTEITK